MIDLSLDRISKRYFIPDASAPRSWYSAFGSHSKEMWALRDVSFDVKRGEALGVVGHNGAGKTTILKLLSGITTPTRGQITIRGRLAALVEVGSGFHPELTGRENIYLYGAMLGMRRSEIARKWTASSISRESLNISISRETLFLRYVRAPGVLRRCPFGSRHRFAG